MSQPRLQIETSDEHSPLINPQLPQSEVEDGNFHGLKTNKQDTKSVWYLILLTLGIGGLQIVWSVELSNGSPYLLSLGMSKSLLAFVWIAGPLYVMLAC